MAETRRLAAIMFTDMVGFTASAQSDETRALRLLKEQEELVRPVLAADHGREIKSTGDGFLVEFESALHAVQCAIDIHTRLYERNARAGGTPIKLRIGVHLGDVEERGNDIFGDAVNVAARIEPLAPPGGICISGQVFNLVHDKIPNEIEKLAPKRLKNVRFPMDVYRVRLPWEVPEPPSGAAARTRLAVLPLKNISPDPNDEYFADGLTEELISTLSNIGELRVIARTSVNQYKATAKPVSQIGAELDVASVLEGSVRKAGDRLRITLQLTDTSTQEPIWVHSYDRQLDDIFALQTEVAEKTGAALRVELLGPEGEAIRKKPTSNLAAYNLYLKGIHASREATYEGYSNSIKFFNESLRQDPEYSPTYSSLANVYILLAGETMAPREVLPQAQQLVKKALELDPSSSEAHTARGNLALQYEQDWTLSESEFKRAISLNPSNANAHFWYAMLLLALQRFDQASGELRTTVELDPLWQLPAVFLMVTHFAAGDLETAIAEAEEERDRDPGNPGPHIDLGIVYARAGRIDDARKEAELSAGDVSDYDGLDRAVLWAKLGKPEEARQLIAEGEQASRSHYVNPSRMAALYAALGEKERAFEWLDRDYDEGTRGLWFDYQLMAFDPIREDSKFQSMLARLNLPSLEVKSGPANSSVTAD